MKTSYFLFLTTLALCFGCQKTTDNSEIKILKEQIVKLENELEESKEIISRAKQNQTLAIIGITSFFKSSIFFDSPWDEFFSAPEFWETIIEVDESLGGDGVGTCERECIDKFSTTINTDCKIEGGTYDFICRVAAKNVRNSCIIKCREN